LPGLFPPAAGKVEAGPDPRLTAMLDAARRSPDVIDVGTLEELIDGDPAPVLVDVRTPKEFAEEHIADSVNVPLADLAPGVRGLPNDLATPIVTLCNVGRISLDAMLMLKAMGYRRVHNLMGGLNAWVSEGHPLDAD
jgi:rhodanese-related sulfurtransferase